MNCFETRRTLLADPRRRTHDLKEHLGSCTACRRLSDEVAKLDGRIADAAAVRAPEALAERILLRRRGAPVRQYAAAAAIVIASAVGIISGSQLNDVFFPPAVQAVGPAHPAIAAISEVSEDAFRPAQTVGQAPHDVERVLGRLGLTVKKGEATAAHYVGKCHVAGSDCDHIVLSTSDAQANVILVPDHPVGDRLIVADRRMIALVNPAGAGGYIVVADSPRKARRIEKLLIKG